MWGASSRVVALFPVKWGSLAGVVASVEEVASFYLQCTEMSPCHVRANSLVHTSLTLEGY